jgi:uncharacterized protein (TIGR03437 family)
MLRSLGKLCGTLLLAGGSMAWAQQYTITTVAGGAPPSTPVSAAGISIGQPNRVMVDSKGNLYFSSSNAVFKIDGGGNLTLIAGNSRAGFSGDGGPAVQAQLNFPQGLALDPAGNLYIADSKNHRVRVVNPSGVISTFAGTGATSPGGASTYNDGGLAINALLRLPGGVATDSAGNVYIADTGDNLIRKVTTDGLINSVAGDSYGSFAGDTARAVNAELHSPEDVAVDSTGNIYIADSANAAIRKVTTDGIINTIAGDATVGFTGDGGAATLAALVTPYAVCVDSAGNVYFAENGDSRIRKIDTKANINTIVGNGTAGFGGDGAAATSAELNFPTGLAVDSTGNLYIADSLNHRIRKVAGSNISTIAGNGVLSYSGDGGAATNAQLNTPQAVAADASGNIYIADTANNVVRKVTAAGAISTIAGNGTAGFGGDGGAATSAQLNGPQGIVVDPAGNIYISDTQNARVRKITGNTISTVAGNGTAGFGGDNGAATSAQLNIPIGLALDAANNLYIADFSNNRIRKVSGGAITTVAGSGLAGYSGDGGAPVNAQLTTPAGVAVDASGNLYIGDTGNNAVRMVSGGIITTVAGTGLAGYSGDNGQATSAMVGNPTCVTVDSSGSLYVTDGSARVRKVYSTGFIVTIAGTGVRGYTGDGGSAPFGTLNGPIALALAPNGNLYVADSGNNAIRLLSFGGYELKIGAAVNSASNLAGPVTGGEVVVFYGTNMGPAGLVQNQPDSNGKLSTNLGGTVVNFGNYQAPILYTSASQVAAIVPFAVSGSTVQSSIEYLGQFSAPFPVSVAAANPGIYTADLSGKGLAAAVNLQGGGNTYNNAAHPANAGDYVELFLTGTGQTSPAGVDGQVYAGLSACVQTPVTVSIGGKSVIPQYCGGVPGVVPGLTQINVQVPSGLAAGLVPLTVQFGSVSAQPGVTLAVSGK